MQLYYCCTWHYYSGNDLQSLIYIAVWSMEQNWLQVVFYFLLHLEKVNWLTLIVFSGWTVSYKYMKPHEIHTYKTTVWWEQANGVYNIYNM